MIVGSLFEYRLLFLFFLLQKTTHTAKTIVYLRVYLYTRPGIHQAEQQVVNLHLPIIKMCLFIPVTFSIAVIHYFFQGLDQYVSLK